MSNETQMIQMLQMFMNTVNNLQSVISPIPLSIANLSTTLPRMSDVEERLKNVEANIKLHHKEELADLATSDEVTELKKDIVALTADVLNRIKKIEDIEIILKQIGEKSSAKDIALIDLEKEKIKLQETKIKEENNTQRTVTTAKMDYWIKLLGGLTVAAGGVFAFIRWVLPFIKDTK